MSQAVTADPDAIPSGHRFVTNVLWSWASVLIPLLTGLVLSPYIIRKLGAEGYGLWSLTFSVIGYYNLFDLGFRSAVVRFTAHFHARGEYEKINELFNTTLAYYSGVTLLLLIATPILSRHVDRFFNVTPEYRDDFLWLVLLVGTSISLSVAWNVFTGCVEGFQRFDLSGRIWIITMTLRSCGIAVMLAFGYGLVQMGVWALVTQLISFVLYFVSLRRIFPALRFSTGMVKLSMFKEAAAYGSHTLVASVGGMVLEQTPSVLVGYYRPVAFVGYYSLPLRLLQYAADVVGRTGLVVAPRAAELAAKGLSGEIARLAMYVNRYCLALFMPFSIVLLVFGKELMVVWVGSEFAYHSAPILPVLLFGTALAMAAQYTSASVLFGIGKHQNYARSLLVEGLLNIGGMILLVPGHGIMGAAVVSSGLRFLNRGLLAPWFVCRALNFSFGTYMRSILARPLLTGLPVLALTYWLKASIGPDWGWAGLFLAATGVAFAYLGMAYFTCLQSEHRGALLSWLKTHVARKPRST